MVDRYTVDDYRPDSYTLYEDPQGRWVRYEDHKQIVDGLVGMIKNLSDCQANVIENMFLCKVCMKQVEELDTDDR